jgi:hypothetical protein
MISIQLKEALQSAANIDPIDPGMVRRYHFCTIEGIRQIGDQYYTDYTTIATKRNSKIGEFIGETTVGPNGVDVYRDIAGCYILLIYRNACPFGMDPGE